MTIDEKPAFLRAQRLEITPQAGFQREVRANIAPPTAQQLPGDIQFAIGQLVALIDKHLADHR